MKSLFYDSQTKQITYDGKNGKVNIPNASHTVSLSETTISYGFECILGIIKFNEFSQCLFFCVESEKVTKYNRKLGIIETDCLEKDKNVFKIIKVDYVWLTDEIDSDTASSVANLFETLSFYYTFNEQEEHFEWNGEMIQNFKKWALGSGTNKEMDILSGTLNEFSFNKAQNTIIEKTDNRPLQTYRSPFQTKLKQHTIVENDSKNMMIGHLICGYFESQTLEYEDKQYQFAIMSKISVKKIGTRFLSRGVDLLGKVSFFVETKFTINCEERTEQFTILRGSVPVFWSQNDPLKPHKIQIDKDAQKSREACRKHFELLSKGYGKVVVIDLLGNKKYEAHLSKIYKDFCIENSIDYIHFDLNRYAENIKLLENVLYNKIDEYIRKENINKDKIGTVLKEQIEETGIESKNQERNEGEESIECEEESENEEWTDGALDNEPSEEIEIERDELQYTEPLNVTFRVNCMDCLDRTNIGQFVITKYFTKLNFQIVKSMWVNNGNALSQMYTGSNSLKTELPAKGRLSMLGKMNDIVISANRMLQNRFTDKDKQAVIDLILGRKAR